MTDTNADKKVARDGLTLVLLRNQFYRDNYRRALFVLVMIASINVLLLVSIMYRYAHPQEPQYFATNAQYQLIQWRPLSDPDVDNQYVLQWVADAVRQAFSLDYIHWRAQLQRAAVNFTPSGWYWFVKAFQKSGDLDTLVKLNMVATADITGAPQIVSQGVLDGRYVWKVNLPMMITYSNPTANKIIHQPMKVMLEVVRVPVQNSPNRIAINQFLQA